jgi:hypothetical protein
MSAKVTEADRNENLVRRLYLLADAAARRSRTYSTQLLRSKRFRSKPSRLCGTMWPTSTANVKTRSGSSPALTSSTWKHHWPLQGCWNGE